MIITNRTIEDLSGLRTQPEFTAQYIMNAGGFMALKFLRTHGATEANVMEMWRDLEEANFELERLAKERGLGLPQIIIE